MKGWKVGVILAFCSLPGAPLFSETLFGPWHRFQCPELGFQIPVTDGWQVTNVPNGVVFAMQLAPHPYVRVAVGRITATPDNVESLIHQRMQQLQQKSPLRVIRSVDGREAIMIEGAAESGNFRDVFVMKEPYLYWIGFSAEQVDLWPQYSKTFDIVMDGFHFD